MKLEKDRARLFSRRATFLLGGKLALLTVLAGRMYYLQVVESERYKLMAEDNRVNFRLLPPARGFIVDRMGEYLAVNIKDYQIILVPEQANSESTVNDVLAKLVRLIDLEDHKIRRILKEISHRRAFVPVTIRQNLSWEDVSRLVVNTPDLPGVHVEVGQTRHYPYAEAMAHVLGYVGAVNEKEITGDPLLELPGFKIGRSGVEKAKDLALRGTGGNSKVEVNALGRVIKELERAEGLPGNELQLTLLRRLQDYVGQRIADEKAASVVVMDVHNGDILSMVSVPSFDPNAFSEGLKTHEWNSLLNNPYKPLSNKAIAGQYAPGSTFKLVVALAALKYGIPQDHKMLCPGYINLGDRRFHCWKEDGHGMVDLRGAMRMSCDVWFYDAARRIGVDRLAEMAFELGLGELSGLGLDGESKGLIPTKAWKKNALKQGWHIGETLIAGIGQGYVLATPIQLAVMTARIVNGGKAVFPRLTRQVFEGEKLVHVEEDVQFENIGIPKAHLDIIRKTMDEVVNHPHGTAHGSKIDIVGWEMGGKTGTSQVRRISEEEREEGIRKDKDIEWRLRDHALFVGYAPVDDPRFVVSVIVEHGGGGSKVAAPIARDVLIKTQELMAKAEREELAKAEIEQDQG